MRQRGVACLSFGAALVILASVASELSAQPVGTPGGAASPAPAVTATAGPQSASTPTAAATPQTQTASAPTVTPTPQPEAPADGNLARTISSIGAGLVLLVVAGVLVALTVATYRLLKRFGAALDQRLPIGTRNHWGGFGGGESGWDLSPALALLIAVLVLTIGTVGLGSALVLSALDWRKAELGVTTKPSDATASDKKATASAGEAKPQPSATPAGTGSAGGGAPATQ